MNIWYKTKLNCALRTNNDRAESITYIVMKCSIFVALLTIGHTYGWPLYNPIEHSCIKSSNLDHIKDDHVEKYSTGVPCNAKQRNWYFWDRNTIFCSVLVGIPMVIIYCKSRHIILLWKHHRNHSLCRG